MSKHFRFERILLVLAFAVLVFIVWGSRQEYLAPDEFKRLLRNEGFSVVAPSEAKGTGQIVWVGDEFATPLGNISECLPDDTLLAPSRSARTFPFFNKSLKSDISLLSQYSSGLKASASFASEGFFTFKIKSVIEERLSSISMNKLLSRLDPHCRNYFGMPPVRIVMAALIVDGYEYEFLDRSESKMELPQSEKDLGSMILGLTDHSVEGGRLIIKKPMYLAQEHPWRVSVYMGRPELIPGDVSLVEGKQELFYNDIYLSPAKVTPASVEFKFARATYVDGRPLSSQSVDNNGEFEFLSSAGAKYRLILRAIETSWLQGKIPGWVGEMLSVARPRVFVDIWRVAEPPAPDSKPCRSQAVYTQTFEQWLDFLRKIQKAEEIDRLLQNEREPKKIEELKDNLLGLKTEISSLWREREADIAKIEQTFIGKETKVAVDKFVAEYNKSEHHGHDIREIILSWLGVQSAMRDEINQKCPR